MLIATLLSALALTAATPDPWSCDLAPSIGQGTSDEGPIDSITTLSFGCRYELAHILGIGISPTLGIDRQLWSVYSSDSGAKTLSSYETQDLQLGFQLHRVMTENSKIFYGFAHGQGRGSLNKTESSANTSINGTYNGLTQTVLSHTFGMSYDLTSKLSLTVAWQRQNATAKWSAQTSDLFIQSIDENNALTLSDGSSTQLIEGPIRTSSQRTSNALQIGLSLALGS